MEKDGGVSWHRDFEQGQEYNDLHDSDHVQEAAKSKPIVDVHRKCQH